MKSAVTIVSGGMDSVTLAYYLANQGYQQHILSFNYGQRHKRELTSAIYIANKLGCEHSIINIPEFGSLLKGSALTDDVEVPEGHYSASNMAITVVPNRNAIMLSMAWGVAVAEGAQVLAYGAHKGDRAQYPDCREEFVFALQKALQIGNEGLGDPSLHLWSPFVNMTKAEIVGIGLALKVPYVYTWSCYRGGDIACGTCGTCVERLQSFDLNGVNDPIPYKDRETWRRFIKEFEEQHSVK